MKKSMIFVGMLAIGYANAQEGKVGVNIENPSATLQVKSKTGIDNSTNNLELTNAENKTLVKVTDLGYVGIGRTPEVDLDIKGSDGGNAEIKLTRYTDTNNGANLTILKAKGTLESPSTPTGVLANIRAGGYTGGGTHPQTTSGYDLFASQIMTTVAGDVNTNGTLPTNMVFTVTNKAGQRNYLLKLQSDSGIGVGFNSTEDIKARLHINDWNDVTLSSTRNALLIGRENSVNLVMDSNEIMVRNNGAPHGLSLQAQGGDLFVNTENTDVAKRFYFRSNTGNLGLGVADPTEKLEVNGAIKVSNTASTCTASNRGAIKFENDNFYGCKSTGWVLLNN